MSEVEFDFSNNIYKEEVDLIIKHITKEIKFIEKNKNNLTRYLYLENIKGKVLYLDFKRFLDEIQRMSIEIQFLENKRLDYIKIKERQLQ